MHLQSDRPFQVWGYTVSHGQLLIRSPKSQRDPENIDIAFFGVVFMILPAGLLNVTIEDALPEEVAEVQRQVRDPSQVQRVYAVVSQGRRYLVAAAAMSISKNALDLRETELDFFGFVKRGQRIVEDSAS